MCCNFFYNSKTPIISTVIKEKKIHDDRTASIAKLYMFSNYFLFLKQIAHFCLKNLNNFDMIFERSRKGSLN